MENKPILVTQSTLPLLEDYIEKLKVIWETHWLTNNGQFHEQLEHELSTYLDVPNVTLYTNGHLALENAIQALDLKGEVITTPFTFASTTHAIVRNGLTPVFCDINEQDYTIDVNKIEALITDKTCAIVPVHVYGNVCDVDEIEKIANKYKLKVIYDAAHAFGVKKNKVGISNFGDISMFSFHATKVFNTIEGGALVYKNNFYKEKFNQLKNFGIVNAEEVKLVGGNAKMNEFQAAMGLCNLKNIDESILKRKKIVEAYKKNLKEVKGIIILKEQKDVESNYAYFPIVVNEKEYGISRDKLCEVLASHKIYSRKYFYPLINSFECYRDNYDINETPVAKKIAERVLTLPLYSELSLEDCKYICQIISEVKYGK